MAARGYAYVACSRFKTRAGCYLYGKLRVSDFLPAGEAKEDEVLERGCYSVSSDDSEGCGLEYAFQPDDSEYIDSIDYSEDQGILAVDF